MCRVHIDQNQAQRILRKDVNSLQLRQGISQRRHILCRCLFRQARLTGRGMELAVTAYLLHGTAR